MELCCCQDEDDTDEELYVDSDGLIGVTDFIERTPSVKIQDGNWHMYTFTTNPPGEEGYKVYVDGIIAGEVDAEKLAGTAYLIDKFAKYKTFIAFRRFL